ncbi:hypothetical protein C8R45DRAFT_922685 [Mycena sanguinolenta]|nr:hypothetical protein C8R45DRAFT_922685 [Mycena sanguinolenta]
MYHGWSSMAMHCHAWSRTTMHGHAWPYMATGLLSNKARHILRSSDASDSPAVTQATRHHPHALYDVPVQHPAYCASSARCVRPFSVPPFSLPLYDVCDCGHRYTLQSPSSRLPWRHIDFCMARLPHFPHVPHLPLSLVPLDHPARIAALAWRHVRSAAIHDPRSILVHGFTDALHTALAPPRRRVHATRLFARRPLASRRHVTGRTIASNLITTICTPPPPSVLIDSTARLRARSSTPPPRHLVHVFAVSPDSLLHLVMCLAWLQATKP